MFTLTFLSVQLVLLWKISPGKKIPVFSTDGMVLSFPILVKPLHVLSDIKMFYI